MKKHLVAAAVATAFGLPAMAQNVTISGLLETGFQDLELSNTTAVVKTNNDLSGISGGIFGSSRIVIGGSEDLGGGLKAGFRLESSLDASNGRMGSGTLAGQAGSANGSIFNRGAEVNLSGAFGMVRIGKFDHRGGEDTDINVVGNIALATGNPNGNLTATGVEIGSDRNSTIAYRTPNLGFTTIEVAHSQKAGQKTAAADAADAAGEGAVQSIYAEGTIAGINYRVGYAKQERVTAVGAANDDATRQGLGVSYNFGPLSASLHYGKATLIDQTENKEYTVSVNIPLGNGLDLRGVYQDFDSSVANAASLDTADRKTYTVALAKALSKRTNLYAAYTDNDRTSTAQATAADSRRIYLGVGHNF